MSESHSIQKPQGKLGVLIPGLGAVGTTFIAGVEAIKQKRSLPYGSLALMGTVRLGKRTENRVPPIREFVPLSRPEDLVFGGWDLFEDNGFQAAQKAGVLGPEDLQAVKGFLEAVKPMKAVFDGHYVKNLNGSWIKEGKTKYDLALQLLDDIATFKAENGLERMVMIWCGSTEIFLEADSVHQTPEYHDRPVR